MTRTDYKEAAEQARRDARNASRRSFLTLLPLLNGLAGLTGQLWPRAIRWIPGREYEGYVLLSLAACLAWFAAVLGYRSLRRQHWIFAFFCLGPLGMVAGVVLLFGLAKSVMMRRIYADPWILAACIPTLMLLGLMIDLKHPPPVPRSQPGRSLAKGITGAGLVVVMFCTFVSFGAPKFVIACAVVPMILIGIHATMWKIRTARCRAEESEAITPAPREDSSLP